MKCFTTPLFSFAMLLALMSGCGKSEVSEECSYFMGEWKWIGYKVNEPSSIPLEDQWFMGKDLVPPTKDVTITLNSDGTVIIKGLSLIPKRGRLRDCRCTEFTTSELSGSMFMESPVFKSITLDRSSDFGWTEIGIDTLGVQKLNLPIAIPEGSKDNNVGMYFSRQ